LQGNAADPWARGDGNGHPEVVDALRRWVVTAFLTRALVPRCARPGTGSTGAGYRARIELRRVGSVVAVLGEHAACTWVAKGEPLCLIGDSGTGKSHPLIGLGATAAMAGHRVKYVLAAKLVDELVEAADERVLSKTIARYGRVDLLCRRLTFGGNIIETGTTSYRIAHARAQRAGRSLSH